MENTYSSPPSQVFLFFLESLSKFDSIIHYCKTLYIAAKPSSPFTLVGLFLHRSFSLNYCYLPFQRKEMSTIESLSHESARPSTRAWGWLMALPEKLWGKVVDVAEKIKKLGEDDPRRITHSLKVGLALTLVSIFYYIYPTTL